MANTFYTEIVADQNFASMLDGNTFRWFDFSSLASGASKSYLVYIPSGKEVWFYGRAFSGRGDNLELRVYSNPVFTAQGSSMTDRIFNRNSKSNTVAESQIWQNPTITNDGVLTDYDDTAGAVGQGNKGSSGSDASQEFPRILPSDSYFLARVTNIGTNPAHFSYKLFWSEFNED